MFLPSCSPCPSRAKGLCIMGISLMESTAELGIKANGYTVKVRDGETKTGKAKSKAVLSNATGDAPQTLKAMNSAVTANGAKRLQKVSVIVETGENEGDAIQQHFPYSPKNVVSLVASRFPRIANATGDAENAQTGTDTVTGDAERMAENRNGQLTPADAR